MRLWRPSILYFGDRCRFVDRCRNLKQAWFVLLVVITFSHVLERVFGIHALTTQKAIDRLKTVTLATWRQDVDGERLKGADQSQIDIYRSIDPKKLTFSFFGDPRSVHFLTSIYVYIYRGTGGGRVAAAQFCKPTAPTPQTETIEIINFAKSLLFAEGLTTS
jgi:hypothetical protein